MTDRRYASLDDESLLIIASLIAENVHQEHDDGGVSDIFQDELRAMREATLDEIEQRGLQLNKVVYPLLDMLLRFRHASPLTADQQAAVHEFTEGTVASLEKLGRHSKGKRDDA